MKNSKWFLVYLWICFSLIAILFMGGMLLIYLWNLSFEGFILIISLIPIQTLLLVIGLTIKFSKKEKPLEIAPLLPDKTEEKEKEEELLRDLKNNMNQIQDYIINLHQSFKKIKKFIGYYDPDKPKRGVKSLSVIEEDLNTTLMQIEKVREKLKQPMDVHEQVNKSANTVERPAHLDPPDRQEYILPKREERYVSDFPTQRFLQTNEPENKKSITLSQIFDREKTKIALDDSSNSYKTEELLIAPTIEFDDQSKVMDNVGLNINNLDYDKITVTDNDRNEQPNINLYNTGELIFYEGKEFTIITTKQININKTWYYELVIHNPLTGETKTIIKK